LFEPERILAGWNWGVCHRTLAAVFELTCFISSLYGKKSNILAARSSLASNTLPEQLKGSFLSNMRFIERLIAIGAV
jgi:hypothetical protein